MYVASITPHHERGSKSQLKWCEALKSNEQYFSIYIYIYIYTLYLYTSEN